ncbi:unnamed protein product [Orchesella dallaii]|uniref:NACHT domain-containing protein n=1 Tax=Orchesella dallaii TaxID=48710 RepID=A0ABP1S8W0_9HEXA
MNQWEREIILANLPELISFTRCNSTLLSILTASQILSKEDEAVLEAKLKSDGSITQTKFLYEITISRKGGFHALMTALDETSQTGALKILEHGIKRQLKLNLTTILSQQLLSFQGNEVALNDILDGLEPEVQQQIGLSYLTHKPNLYVKIKDTIPKQPMYYIPRCLTTRSHLNPTLFQKPGKNVFVIRRIQLHELSSLAGNNGTDLSSNQIEALTKQFILLEYEDDFEKICEVSNGIPVHLIDHNDGQFTWVRSHGNLIGLQGFVHKKQKKLTEEELVSESLTSNQPVCVSDAPGMGKTLLLSRIAHYIKQKRPNELVQFIVFSELVHKFKNSRQTDLSEIIDFIAEQSCEIEFGREIVRQLIKCETTTTNLIFDGFDEVLSSQLETAKIILRTISELKSVRVYVATRPHMRNELENTLGVFSYNIQAFGKFEQIEFLVGYWQNQCCAKRSDLLKNFAENCLTTFKESMKDFELGIAGIPLQCLLLAEVYKYDAIKFSNPEKTLTNLQTSNICQAKSIFGMYESLMDMRFSRFGKNKNRLMEQHIYAALQLLFPATTKHLEENLIIKKFIETTELYSIGILEKTGNANETTRFLHRTFAEYFVGMFVAKNMTGDNEKFNCFLNVVLQTTQSREHLLTTSKIGECKPISSACFQYPTICYFINAHLKLHQKSLHSNKTWLNKTISTSIYDKLAACIVHDCPALYSQILEVNSNGSPVFAEEVDSQNLIILSAKHSGFEFFKMIHQSIPNNSTGKPFPSQIWACSPKFLITPLHIAVERGDFTITEYLLNPMKDSEIKQLQYIMHCCIAGSASHDKIDEKLQIIKLLLKRCKDWVNESFPDGTTPILNSNSSFKLIKELIEAGTNINALSSNGSMFHRLIEGELTPEICQEFVLFLQKWGFNEINSVDSKHRTPLHITVLKTDLFSKTLRLFHEMGANINAVDYRGDSVLFYAIRGKRSANFINHLVFFGVDISHKNSCNENVLHLCAKYGNQQTFEYFLNSSAIFDPLESPQQNGTSSVFSSFNNMTNSRDPIISKNLVLLFLFTMNEGKCFSVRIIKLMQQKGLPLSNELASEALKAILCNRNLQDWELGRNFVETVDYLIASGGVVTCRYSRNPWVLEATHRNVQRFADATQCDGIFLEELCKRGVIKDKEKELFIGQSTASYKNICISVKTSSFEKTCSSLLACNQRNAFAILKQCLQTDMVNSSKFITHPNGMLDFIQSKEEMVIILQSWDLVLTIERLTDTIDPNLVAISGNYQYSQFPKANLLLLLFEVGQPTTPMIEHLKTLGTKTVCVCSCSSIDIGEVEGCALMTDEISWEDLSTEYQQEIALDLCFTAFGINHYFSGEEGIIHISSLKNELLVAFIRCKQAVFKGVENHPHKHGRGVLSKNIFDYILPDKLLFYGITEDALRTFTKFGHRIATFDFGINIENVDYVIIEKEQEYHEIVKKTEDTVHLIQYLKEERQFVMVRSSGNDMEIQRFIEKKICAEFPACRCHHTTADLNIHFQKPTFGYKNRTCFNFYEIPFKMRKFVGLQDTYELLELSGLFKTKFEGGFELLDFDHSSSHAHQTAEIINSWLLNVKCDKNQWKMLHKIALHSYLLTPGLNFPVSDIEMYIEKGILKKRLGSLAFSHNAFSLFLVANLVLGIDTIDEAGLTELRNKLLRDCLETQSVSFPFKITPPRFYLDGITSFTFKNRRLFQFIDYILSEQTQPSTLELKTYLSDNFDMETLQSWIFACVQSNHFNLLEILLSLGSYSKLFESNELVLLAVKYADILVINLILEKFTAQTGKTINDIKLKHYSLPSLCLLHVAALRGNYLIMNFLVHRCDEYSSTKLSDTKDILKFCVVDTNNLLPVQLNERKQMIDFLIQTEFILITEETKFSLMDVSDLRIHVDLFIHLLKYGLNIDCINKNELLFDYPRILDCQGYDNFMRHIYSTMGPNILHTCGPRKITLLHFAVKNFDLLDSTLELFSTAKVDFNSVDMEDNPVLFYAVKGFRSASLIEKLVQRGANMHTRNGNGTTVLHVAAGCGNLTAARYLISLGCKINARDNDNDTPLHKAMKYCKTNTSKILKLLTCHGTDVVE